MTRKVFVLILALILALTLTACENGSDSGNHPGETDNPPGVTLDSMKNAARDAGYEVEDSYTQGWGEGITGGFSVDYHDTVTPILEFKDKASADAVAKKELDAGYNCPVQNGKFLTFASASGGVIEDEDEKAFFENLINGRTIPNNNAVAGGESIGGPESGNGEIVGVWEQWMGGVKTTSFEFAADNQFIITSLFGNEQGTYTAQGDTILLTNENEESETWKYITDGDMLIMTGSDGEALEFYREGTFTPDNDGGEVADDGITLAAYRKAVQDENYD